MKKIVFQIIFSVLCISAQAQKVSNIRAEQRGQYIVVLYSLETTSPCEVSLLLSQDNGVTWGSTLKNVSGDVGKNISAGQKSITWKVLEEQDQLVGSKIKFKVVSTGKKALAPVDHTHFWERIYDFAKFFVLATKMQNSFFCFTWYR